MATNNGIVRLNVGGQVFHTTSQTLCKEPDSFLARFCEVDGMQPSVKDETSAFFIDRDPCHFRIILNYLRSDVIDLEDSVSLDALRSEADFYCLSGLTKRLSDMRDKPLQESERSTVKTVWVTTHHGKGFDSRYGYDDISFTKFASRHADVLARIASTESLLELCKPMRTAIKVSRDQVLCENQRFEMPDICDILGTCGFVFRFTKEKSAQDTEFLFSSV